MGQYGAMIAASGSLALVYSERLMAGLTQQNYARFARPGGVELRSNHPAFILGHLCIYPQRILQQLGLVTDAAKVPAAYEPLFKNGVECQDDPQGKIYPPLDEIQGNYFKGYRAAINAVAEASDQKLLELNPLEGRMRELFPTLGAAFTFYLAGHTQSHLGQLSAWRRAQGLAPA